MRLENHMYRMPAEWTKHECTFMEWPVSDKDWKGTIHQARIAYAEIARSIARFEPVIMLALPELADEARRMCGPGVNILKMRHDDSWMRDNGPTFILSHNNMLAGINWKFNAWGGKHYPWDLDDLVAPTLLKLLDIPCFDAPIVLEGGSIHVDGEGTLLTTEECLLNPNRNPHLSKHEIEEILKQYLGVEKVIWLKKGIYGDETDGHVDNVACFVRPGSVMIQCCSDRGDPNYDISRENTDILRRERDAKGRPIEIITVDQPPETHFNGKRLPLSYINFYFVNGGIIMPVFGGHCSDTDRKAEETFKRTFPDRKIVTVNGLPIVKGGGCIHCITQQMPAGYKNKVNWGNIYEEGNAGRNTNEL